MDGREQDRLSVLEIPYPILIGIRGDESAQHEAAAWKGPPPGLVAPLVDGSGKV